MSGVTTSTATVQAVWSNPWVTFTVRRLRRLLISLWVLATASFLMIHLIPGDPVRGALGMTAPAELVRAKREALGLNDPLFIQYWNYVTATLSGDFGTSMTTGQSVSQVIGERLPATLALAIAAFVVAIVISVPLGASMAVLTRGGRRRGGEMAFTSTTVLVAAIPEFLLAVGLVYVFGVHLSWFPVAGRSDLSSYVLPVVALSLGAAAVLARLVRVEMLSVLGLDFVRTARAKRLPSRLVYIRHALPNALTATLTVAGLLLTGLVAGTVLVETVFAWPGVGATIVQSIQSKDYPMVQGIVLVYGLMVLGVNLIVDVLIAVLDPRSTIRES